MLHLWYLNSFALYCCTHLSGWALRSELRWEPHWGWWEPRWEFVGTALGAVGAADGVCDTGMHCQYLCREGYLRSWQTSRTIMCVPIHCTTSYIVLMAGLSIHSLHDMANAALALRTIDSASRIQRSEGSCLMCSSCRAAACRHLRYS